MTPKKIYLQDHEGFYSMSTFKDQHSVNLDYISSDALKEWIKQEDEHLQFQGVVRIDELFKFLEDKN